MQNDVFKMCMVQYEWMNEWNVFGTFAALKNENH